MNSSMPRRVQQAAFASAYGYMRCLLVILLVTKPQVAAFSSLYHTTRSSVFGRQQSSLLASVSAQVGVCSIAGSDSNRPQKVNQDASFVVELENYTCYGVMDGHGLKGHILTEYLSKQLPDRIEQELLQEQNDEEEELLDFLEKLVRLANFELSTPETEIHKALVRAFHRAHLDAMRNPEIPAGRSGTTCLVCLADDTELHVAYVGDSRVIQIQTNGTIELLASETTTKKMEDELLRINNCQGRVDEYGNIFYGPQGISMTRSLGNAVMLRAGIVPTPCIKSVPRRQGVVVMATDGVWDVMSNQDVAAIAITRIDAPQEAAVEIVQEAKRRWIGDLPFVDEAKVDDITCIIFES